MTQLSETIEQRVIESALQTDRFQDLHRAGLMPEHFEDRTFATFYEAAVERSRGENPVDKVEIVLDLKSSQRIDEGQATRLIALRDISQEAAGGVFVSTMAAELIEAANRRKANELICRAALYRNDGEQDREAELLAKAAELIRSGGKGALRWEALQLRKFNPAVPVEKTVPILEARGCPLVSRGNLTMLSGTDKSGKSHVAAAMIRAITEGSTHLGMTARERGKVAYIDCEQATEDFDELLRTQANGTYTAPEAYCLTGSSPKDCRADFEAILENTPGLAAALVDGFADLIEDVNDSEQAVELVAWLMRMADRYRVGIIGVLHLNPGSNSKTRGHLGSQLERKCRTVLSIATNGEERVLFTRKARKKALPESQGIRFTWDDESHGFVEINGTPGEVRQAQKVEEWTRTLYEIQAETGMLAWKHGDLKAAIQKAEGVRDRAARNRIKQMLDAGLLGFNGTRGIYTSRLENGTDHENA